MNGTPKSKTIRLIKDRCFKYLIIILSFVTTLPLFFILFSLAHKGISSINWQFFVNVPKPVGEPNGGIANALWGTVILIVLASLFSIPLGVLTGVYLSEFKKSRMAWVVGLCVDLLLGIPSIVIGIIAYLWLVKPLKHFSALSGAVALALMMLPVIIKSTEETLKLIPESLREASLALGANYSTTILKVVLPAGISGILSGILLGVARIAGETAPLLFTAFGNPFMNWNILKPVNSLPLIIFDYAISPYEEWHRLAWGAAFVLVMMVLLLNLAVRFGSRRWRIRF